MEVASLKQENYTITEFFTKPTIIWDELENYRHDSDCIARKAGHAE